MEARNQELERDNRILEAQKATVVVKNPEFGTFEYIGVAIPLAEGVRAPEPKSVNDVIQALTQWLNKYDRVTPASILKSLD